MPVTAKPLTTYHLPLTRIRLFFDAQTVAADSRSCRPVWTSSGAANQAATRAPWRLGRLHARRISRTGPEIRQALQAPASADPPALAGKRDSVLAASHSVRSCSPRAWHAWVLPG